ASPPLVVAYALAGTVDLDLKTEPLGTGKDGKPVYLKDIWPTQAEIAALVARTVSADQFAKEYADVYKGDLNWRAIDVPEGDTFAWDPESTYVRNPPYFDGLKQEPAPFADVKGARALAVLGDSITTDHISPAGDIAAEGPAAEYLRSRGVEKKDFNSFGARRGNHEVMMRGTFANVRLKNLIFKIAGKEVEGGYTLHQPSGEQMSIFDCAMRYKDEGVPAVVLGGKEYGSGSSRDWAAKGPALQGVRAVIAESYERIHRSNLVGMGVAPLQFKDGDSVASLGLTGAEVYDIEGLAEGVRTGFEKGREVTVRATANEMTKSFKAVVRVDTPQEVEYMRHGGILQYVLRRLLKA
ncbi:MAG: aconitate hydratase, partial [Candidatus Methylomirabilis sp.]|nr:aconitate hydratase [Deltaproteobacteria bacterium]